MDKLAAIALAALLGACATAANYNAQLSTWIGRPETALVAEWGAPASIYDAPDGSLRVLNYNSARTFSVPASSGPIPVTQRCVTHFNVRAGIIESANATGDGCAA